MPMLMPQSETGLVIIQPDHFDHDPFNRIGIELQRVLADTLTKPMPRDMRVLLKRLERLGLDLRQVEVLDLDVGDDAGLDGLELLTLGVGHGHGPVHHFHASAAWAR